LIFQNKKLNCNRLGSKALSGGREGKKHSQYKPQLDKKLGLHIVVGGAYWPRPKRDQEQSRPIGPSYVHRQFFKNITKKQLVYDSLKSLKSLPLELILFFYNSTKQITNF